MNIKKNNFYTLCKKTTLSKKRGFTLIELMVVVSIIALLSAIALEFLGSARLKARNAAKNSLVLQYTKALELHWSDYSGTYPRSDSSICFGYATSETCYISSSYIGSDTITAEMSNYLPGDFASRTPVPYLSNDLKGVIYSCPTAGCSNYTLTWYLESNVTRCIDEARQDYQFGHTRCVYDLN